MLIWHSITAEENVLLLFYVCVFILGFLFFRKGWSYSYDILWFMSRTSTVNLYSNIAGIKIISQGLTLSFSPPCIIIIYSFYTALFSALEQTHCAYSWYWHVILNEWLYPFIARIINSHRSGVLVALCGFCMASAMWNAAILAQALCTPFSIAPGYSVTSFKAT